MNTQDSRFRLLLGLAILGFWGTALFTTSRTTLWDRDESRYGTAALEMTASGNFLFPTFNHELRAFQPAMIYWLMAASTRVFGPTEFAVRFPSTAAMALVCLLTALIARRLAGDRIALASAVVAGTTPILFLMGTAATTDAVLLGFIILAQWVFVEAWCGGWRRWHVPVMGLAIGGGLLTKGPLGLVVPVGCMVAALVLARGRHKAAGSGWRIVVAAGTGAALFLAWGLPANAATGGDFWRIAVIERLPARIFTAMEGHGGGDLAGYMLHLPFYLVVLAAGLFPWAIYLPGILSGSRGSEGHERPMFTDGTLPLLKAMIVPPFVLFTLLATKLPHYILPVVPWLAIGIGSLIAGDRLPAGARRLVRQCSLAAAGTAIMLAFALVVAPLVLPALADLRTPLILGGLLLGFSAALALPAQLACDFPRAAKVQAAAMVAFFWLCALVVLPRAEAVTKPGQTLGRIAAPLLGPAIPVAAFEWTEPGIHFYLGGRKIEQIPDAGSLAAWCDQPGTRAVVLRADRHSQLSPSGALAGFSLIAEASGHDHVRGGLVRLVMLRRD
jgi:4-amino-4-deoxy-L-arabinose transferase-like glycosyltransferase